MTYCEYPNLVKVLESNADVRAVDFLLELERALEEIESLRAELKQREDRTTREEF